MQWLKVLIFFSFVYLIIELAFSARLLDVVWSSTQLEAIEGVEYYGRMISGFAVWLAIFGFIVFRYVNSTKGRFTLFLAFFVGMPVTITAVYQGQEKLVEHLVDSASTDELRRSFYASLLSNAYKDGDVILTGAEFDMSLPELVGGDLKTFGALLPFIAMNTPGFEQKLERDVRKIVRRQVLKEMDTPQELYRKAYLKPREDLTQQYEKYRQGSNKYTQELGKQKDHQEREWKRYRDRVYREFRKEPHQITDLFQKKQVLLQTRKSLKHLPPNWDISDKRVFKQAVQKQFTADALVNYKNEMMRQSGFYIRPGLSQDSFIKQNELKKKWNNGFYNTEFKDNPPAIGSSFKTFVDKQYNPLIEQKIDSELKKLKATDQDLLPGGKYYEDARNTMKMTIVPVIALIFSLVGGVFHVAKMTMMLLRLVVISSVSLMGAAVVLLVAGLAPLAQNSDVADSSLYVYLEANVPTHYELATRWVLHLENSYYPINEWLRINVLQEFDFE